MTYYKLLLSSGRTAIVEANPITAMQAGEFHGPFRVGHFIHTAKWRRCVRKVMARGLPMRSAAPICMKALGPAALLPKRPTKNPYGNPDVTHPSRPIGRPSDEWREHVVLALDTLERLDQRRALAIISHVGPQAYYAMGLADGGDNSAAKEQMAAARAYLSGVYKVLRGRKEEDAARVVGEASEQLSKAAFAIERFCDEEPEQCP